MATSMRLRNTFRVQFYLRNDVILLPKLKLNVAKTSINPHCMYCVRHCTSYTIQKQLPNITRRYMITTKNIRLNSTNLRKTYLREYSTNLNSVDETIKTLAKEDLSVLCSDIQEELNTSNDELRIISQYHFDGEGKAFRPMMVVLMSKACNTHHNQDSRTDNNNMNNSSKNHPKPVHYNVLSLNQNGVMYLRRHHKSRTLLHSQYRLAMITEMIHTASLIHDDVIDASPTRRGKPTVYKVWGEKKAILAGDYVLSVASLLLARLRNENVIVVLSQVIEDLVRGEFMQLGSKEDENERFHHYLLKTYKKTASLIANSCKAAAILGDSHPEVCDIAYNFGRNIGMAFQLIDDVLDFVSSSATFGKPTTADLNLGLATAPVLFAADKFPELHEMIMRRFRQEGDVDKARLAVEESDGIQQTRFLAERHCDEAIRQIKQLKASQEQAALINLAGFVLSRIK